MRRFALHSFDQNGFNLNALGLNLLDLRRRLGRRFRVGCDALLGAAVLGLAASMTPAPAAAQSISVMAPSGEMPETVASAFDLFSPDLDLRRSALTYFEERGDRDAIPAMILALRFSRGGWHEIVESLAVVAGESAGDTWTEWMLWQEAHPEIVPFEGFDKFQSTVYAHIDRDFLLFLREGVEHEIRLEEIAWGGVVKDGIPALTNPKLIAADAPEARYLTDQELVFGVEINGDARAYPLRQMDWHEMFNDVIGGVAVSLAYCTLCGSGILFETTVEGRDAPFVFGSSGFLYRSNKLMYDQETHSLWNQFTGRPVVGPLTGSGFELKTRPVVITSWKKWRERHPDTAVLSIETGYQRDYTPGAPYSVYFQSPNLMFPTLVDQSQLRQKDYVFALRGASTEKAWPLARFEDEPVVNDVAGAAPLTLIGDPSTRAVRAYRTDGQRFAPGADEATLLLDGEIWRVTEAALIGPNGEELTRLPGHVAYWFAWSGYFGEDGELAIQ